VLDLFAALLVGALVTLAEGGPGVLDGDESVGTGVVGAEGLAALVLVALVVLALDVRGVGDRGEAVGAREGAAEGRAALLRLALAAVALYVPGVRDRGEAVGAADGVAVLGRLGLLLVGELPLAAVAHCSRQAQGQRDGSWSTLRVGVEDVCWRGASSGAGLRPIRMISGRDPDIYSIGAMMATSTWTLLQACTRDGSLAFPPR